VVLNKAIYQVNLNGDSIRGNIKSGNALSSLKIGKIFTALDSWENIIGILDVKQTKLKRELVATLFYFGTSIYVKAKKSNFDKNQLKLRKRQLLSYLILFVFKTNKQNIVKRFFAVLRLFDIVWF